jgi:PAS domain S-box-containing protein
MDARLRELETELLEARETLDAIRNGEVDAVVVGGPDGQIIYTLENADRPYRVLVEQMREGAVTLSGDGTILYCNASFAEFIGQPARDAVGEHIFDFVAEHSALQRMLEQAGPEGQSAELTFLTPLGDPAPANLSIVELSVEEGAERMFCLIVTDLRQNYARAKELFEANRQLAEEIADRSRVERSLALALDAADMGSWDIDLATGEAMRSIRHDGIFGYPSPPPRWGLADTLEHFIPEDILAVEQAFETARTTGRLDFEGRIRRASDAATRWVHVQGSTLYEDGVPSRIAGIVVDNTDRRLIEQQLRQAQKMDAIGQLTGGIAHDFNNLLMIIGGSLEALSRRVQLDAGGQRLLDAAMSGVARGATLNQQLLAFARRQDMLENVVSLSDLLPTFETLLDRAVGEGVKVDIALTPDLWSCKTDAHQLETAILNLAINARDAMENSGKLLLTTANIVIDAAMAEQVEAAPGDYVVVSMTDTGMGLEPEKAARVFEPFFTTKELGRGTGLGLSQVYGFARQSGGFVTFDSVVGQGTTVSIYLPRTDLLTQTPPERGTLPVGHRADGVVLLVEDDADVRGATRSMLEELGYAVEEAASADEALERLAEGAPVDVVFTDVIMATGMNGVELGGAVKAAYPALPVLLTSGYTAQKLTPAAVHGDLPLLRKPYTLLQLSEAMETLAIGKA